MLDLGVSAKKLLVGISVGFAHGDPEVCSIRCTIGVRDESWTVQFVAKLGFSTLASRLGSGSKRPVSVRSSHT
jgi:hypothetical protein